MKKLIAVIGLCMLAYITPASAETTSGAADSTGNGQAKCEKKRLSPEQIVAKIDERLKKLEEHKTKATSAGKAEVVTAIQGVEDSLNNVKSAINAKDRDAVKTAREQLKTAREALKALIPEKAKERHEKNKSGTSNAESSPKL